jgi:hypothetical protein
VGPQGPAGPVGPAGASGLAGYQLVTATTNAAFDHTEQTCVEYAMFGGACLVWNYTNVYFLTAAVATCPAGKVAITGWGDGGAGPIVTDGKVVAFGAGNGGQTYNSNAQSHATAVCVSLAS